jgi:uncharacterized protein
MADLVDTPRGPARVHADDPAGGLLVPGRLLVPRGLLVLGHGAGGGITAPDLAAAAAAAVALGWAVRRVEQPYRVAGRRSPAPAGQLDEAWCAVLATLAAAAPGLPLVAGGRSSGARVACRTAATTGAVGVLCLAFPVHPPGRPERSRLPELAAVGVPVLIVQGDRDPFGMPPEAAGRALVVVPGADHGMRKGVAAVREAVAGWLPGLARSHPAPTGPAPAGPGPTGAAPTDR